jgi:hypothetical protein
MYMLDSIDDEDKRILLIMALAKSAVPLNYVSNHTGIKEPLKNLEKMEKVGLVRRFSPSNWSSNVCPMFEITPRTREELFNYDLSILEKKSSAASSPE